MKRTSGLVTRSLDLRVLSAPHAAQIALVEPARGTAAIAEPADVALAPAADAGGGDPGGGTAECPAYTPLHGTPLSWSELDEWLEAS